MQAVHRYVIFFISLFVSLSANAELAKIDGLSALRELEVGGIGYVNGLDVQFTTTYLRIKAIGSSSKIVLDDPLHPITNTDFMAVDDRISNGGSIIIDGELCHALSETMKAAMETGKADYNGFAQRDFTFGEGASFTKATFPCRYYVNANGLPMLGIAESETITADNTIFTAQGTFQNKPNDFTPQMATFTEATKYYGGNNPDKYLGKYVKLYNPNPDDQSSNMSMSMTGKNGDDDMTATVHFVIDEYDALIDPETGKVIEVLHDEQIPMTNTVRVKDIFHYYSDDFKPTSTKSITGIFAKEADAASETGYTFVIYLYGDNPIEGYNVTTIVQQPLVTNSDKAAYYDFSGRRIDYQIKGVLIHDGKKILKK